MLTSDANGQAQSTRGLGKFGDLGKRAYAEALREGGKLPWGMSKLMFGGQANF